MDDQPIPMHLVFSTKYRLPFLTNAVRSGIFDHIRMNCGEKNIDLKTIGGFVDHVHCLILVENELVIPKVAQLIKGESSYWINKNKLTRSKFSWQNNYYAKRIRPKDLKIVFEYINNQEFHHKTKTFAEEINELNFNS